MFSFRRQDRELEFYRDKHHVVVLALYGWRVTYAFLWGKHRGAGYLV
jgi:hypothetical protein